MPLSEDATLYIRVWIGQRCVACAAEFQYLRRFKVLRRDTMANDTVAKIEAQYAQYALESPTVCPCPNCGWIQPDMIAASKSSYHSSATIGFFLVLFVVAIATSLGVLRPPEIGCYVMAGIASVALLFHMHRAFADSNRLLVLNLDIAKIKVEEGKARLINSGTGFVQPSYHLQLWPVFLAGILLFASVFFFCSPPLLGWPLAASVFPGLLGVVISGSLLANRALALKGYANANKIVEVNSTVVTDLSVPEDFRGK